jgi:F0F1-type ATP synthase assembly protein I
MNATSSKPASKIGTPWGAVSLVFELGYIIAIPAVVFGFAGAHGDKYMETSPLLTISGLACAFLLSAFVVIRRVKAVTQSSF